MNPNRHQPGTPIGGQFAPGVRAAADPSAALQPPTTPESLGLKVGQSSNPVSYAGEVSLQDVRVHRSEAGYELRADHYIDLTLLQAEAFQGVDLGPDYDLELEPHQAVEAPDFLNANREHVDAFLAERWGAENDAATEWDHTRLVLSAQLSADADLADTDALVDDAFGTFTEDMSSFRPASDLPTAFRKFIEARREA